MKKEIMALFAVSILIFSMGIVMAKGKGAACTTIQSGKLLTSAGNVITTGYDEWGYNYQAHMFNGGYCDAYRDAAWCQAWKDDNLIMKWNDAWISNMDCDGDGLLDRHYGFTSYIGSGAWLTNHQSGSYEECTWDVSGNWLLDFAGGTDNREFINLIQDAEGNVVGEFWYLSGTWLYGGTLVGTVTGDSLHLDYDRAPILYTGEFNGTIGDNVITAGTFSDSGGNHLSWTATGTSVEICETCNWNYFTKIVTAPADATLTDGIWYAADGTEIGPVIWGEFATIQEVSNDQCDPAFKYSWHGSHPGFGYY